MKRTKETFSIGFGFLLFCGTMGLISMGVELFKNPDTVTSLEIGEILGPLSVGLFTAVAIVAANIGAGLGIAGISNSIIHCSLVLVTLFNYFVFHQLISFEQAIGICLTFLGAILLAMEDKIALWCASSDKERR